MTHEEIRAHLKNKAYDTVNGKAERDLFDDLVELFELDPKEPIVIRMYSKAWEGGHAGGYYEVYSHFHDLVEVFKGG